MWRRRIHVTTGIDTGFWQNFVLQKFLHVCFLNITHTHLSKAPSFSRMTQAPKSALAQLSVQRKAQRRYIRRSADLITIILCIKQSSTPYLTLPNKLNQTKAKVFPSSETVSPICRLYMPTKQKTFLYYKVS